MTQELEHQTGLPGQRSPSEILIARVRDDVFKQQAEMVLPPSVPIGRFIRVVTSTLITNPEIAKLEHNSVLRCMIQAAADGLIPDGKEAAIVARGGKATYVPMIGGVRRIAAEYGWSVRTAVVYANDEFDHAVIDGDEVITHHPVRPGMDRGELIAAYAIGKHLDGRKMQVVLHPDDIARRRASASTQNVWNTHTAAMWEKSAGHALFKQLPLSEAERERLARVYDAIQVDPEAAAETMYGPSPIRTLPGAVPQPTPADAATPLPVADGQQAAADEASTAPQAAAPDHTEPEPSVDEPESQFVVPPGVNEDPAVAAANAAAMFIPPNGQHHDASRCLSEILALGDKGVNWFRWALRNVTQPQPYYEAVWNFTRVYAPEVFQQVKTEKEAQAA